MRRSIRNACRTWVLALALMIAAACSGSGSPASAQNVTVKEWELQPAQLQVKAGTVIFAVRNGGAIEHDFAVEGVGKLETLPAGGSKRLTLTLAPGTYAILCTLAGHKEAGMHGTLVVFP